MTDIRETQNYEFVLATDEGDIRETQAYYYVLGQSPSSDERETQAYSFVLGQVPDSDERETQAYLALLQDGEVEDRNTLTYFTLLGLESSLIPRECGVLSVILPGPMSIAGEMSGETLARVSSLGETGVIL